MTPPPPGAGMPGDPRTGTQATPQITSQTHGVIGMPHVTLSQGASGSQASVVSSDKNNMQPESGTLRYSRSTSNLKINARVPLGRSGVGIFFT